MYSDNKIALIICQKNDPELKKLRPLPCSYWARSIHPCYCYSYSPKNMKVNAKFIFIVDNKNIPQFFYDILGHPDIIDLRTQEQKKDLAKMVLCIMKAVGKRHEANTTTKCTTKAVGKRNNMSGTMKKTVGKHTIKSIIKNTIKRRRHEPLISLVHSGYYLRLYGCGTTYKSDTSYQNISTCVYATLEGFVQQKTFYRESGRFIIKSENREKYLGQVCEFI